MGTASLSPNSLRACGEYYIAGVLWRKEYTSLMTLSQNRNPLDTTTGNKRLCERPDDEIIT